MYKITYEQIQQLLENCVHSGINVLRLCFLKVIWKVVPYDCTFENSRVNSIRLRSALIYF